MCQLLSVSFSNFVLLLCTQTYLDNWLAVQTFKLINLYINLNRILYQLSKSLHGTSPTYATTSMANSSSCLQKQKYCSSRLDDNSAKKTAWLHYISRNHEPRLHLRPFEQNKYRLPDFGRLAPQRRNKKDAV